MARLVQVKVAAIEAEPWTAFIREAEGEPMDLRGGSAAFRPQNHCGHLEKFKYT
jgi:hypothetical protein